MASFEHLVPAAVAPRRVRFDGSYVAWRDHARALAMASIPPSAVVFADPTSIDDLFATDDAITDTNAHKTDQNFRVPRGFLALAEAAAHHRAPERWGLLYRVLYRITHGEPDLLENAVDDDVHALNVLAKEVRRDAHKMHAFVRFKEVVDAAPDGGSAGEKRYVAWHRPDHLIVPYVAQFFVDRFGAMKWTIMTPDQSVSWDGERVTFGPGVPRSKAPEADELEGLWKAYYASIFNPARLKLSAMRAEMPRKHWATLPEAQLIPTLVRDARGRAEGMVAKAEAEGHSAADYLPDSNSLAKHREAAAHCKGCPLYKTGTQTVFGEGSAHAKFVLVGEQPGDQEDRQGHPFVGPAGKLLDEALAAAGIERSDVYVTNAVKHFKWRPQGKRRLHQKPDGGEIERCKPWLQAELRIIKPEVVLALGASAAQSLLGRKVTINKERGAKLESAIANTVMLTYHPSAILRAPNDTARDEMFTMLVEDLKRAKHALAA